MQKLSSTGVAAIDAPDSGVVSNSGEILRAEALYKSFYSGAFKIAPIDGIDFSIARGEMVAIVGPSGAGKSTFLHLLGALDTPSSGAVYFAGRSLHSLAERELAEYRNRAVGFVWQRHHLLPDFTASENVAMPLLVQGRPLGEALKAADDWLNEVGLASRGGQRAGELSGGEQQRVAIARALVNRPALLLADEPTGDLDERSAENIFELMQRLHKSHNLTSILATHNLSLARRTDRALLLERGKLSPATEIFTEAASLAAASIGSGVKSLDEHGVTRV